MTNAASPLAPNDIIPLGYRRSNSAVSMLVNDNGMRFIPTDHRVMHERQSNSGYREIEVTLTTSNAVALRLCGVSDRDIQFAMAEMAY